MMAATFSSPAPTPKKTESLKTMQLLGLVGEIGFLIAIPAAVFGFTGAYLDERFRTSPWLLLGSLALALASSTLAVWHRIKPILHS